MPERQSRHPDNDLIDRAAEGGMPEQSGSAGGNVARQVGKRAEERNATGGDPEITRVRKSDEADEGDRPTPPQHQR